jgi:hypothetical protein
MAEAVGAAGAGGERVKAGEIGSVRSSPREFSGGGRGEGRWTEPAARAL